MTPVAKTPRVFDRCQGPVDVLGWHNTHQNKGLGSAKLTATILCLVQCSPMIYDPPYWSRFKKLAFKVKSSDTRTGRISATGTLL
jgi:hypothetical protein